MTDPLGALATIVVLGIACQWVAWRLQLPSILLLLITGFLAGPVTGVLAPEPLFGAVLMPFVSLSVAIILFEGGLGLRIAELRGVGGVVRNLISIGIVVSWLFITLAAWGLLDIGFRLSLLLGAILVVTGPTVVGPLLLYIRPKGKVASILKWEGILNDAVGAVLAVLVFEAIVSESMETAPAHILLGVAKTLAVGILLGVPAAQILVTCLRRRWVPDTLDNAVTLALVVGAFAVSNRLQHESGLLTVTVMGIVVANQRHVDVRHLIEFKEHLRTLLLSVLFIVLAARLTWGQIAYIGPASLAFVAALIFLVRPATVFASAWGGSLSIQEKVFLCFLAPRGIVAAAVASVFSTRLAEQGVAGAETLAAVVFLVITCTVIFYGTTARFAARKLGLLQRDAQGVVIAGAHTFGRAIARALTEAGVPATVVDTNWANVSAARMEGIDACYGDALEVRTLESLDLGDKGRLLALTPNDRINSLISLHFSDIFGRSAVFQLASPKASEKAGEETARRLGGRVLFGPEYTFAFFESKLRQGASLRTTRLTPEFTFDDFKKEYGDSAVVLFVVGEDGNVRIAEPDLKLAPKPGQRLISLIARKASENDAIPLPAGAS